MGYVTRMPRFGAAVIGSVLLLSAASASAAPVVGFTEHFAGVGNLAGFGGGATETNPGVGGADGDGYLRVAHVGFAGQLGAFNTSSAYSGDWIAAGVTRVELKLQDVDADQDLEIHFCIGNSNNFWQYNPGFAPPQGSWRTFVVDLSDTANFTHIINLSAGSFSQALHQTDRILIRHDRAPYTQGPDPILGEFGLDDIRLLANAPVDARAASWGSIRAQYR
jgi:hypothetical protein